MKDPKKQEKISELVKLRRYFLSGVATLFPLLITIYAINILFNFSDRLIGRHANAFLQANYGFQIPGLGLMTGFLIIVLMGMISMHVIAKAIWPFFEWIIMRIPFIKNIYPPAKQLSGFLFTENVAQKFGKVALVEYPCVGVFCMGFITNEHLDEFNSKCGRELVSLLIPTPPSPITGYMVLVPKEKVKILDIKIEEAIAFIMSSGVVFPKKENTDKIN